MTDPIWVVSKLEHGLGISCFFCSPWFAAKTDAAPWPTAWGRLQFRSRPVSSGPASACQTSSPSPPAPAHWLCKYHISRPQQKFLDTKTMVGKSAVKYSTGWFPDSFFFDAWYYFKWLVILTAPLACLPWVCIWRRAWRRRGRPWGAPRPSRGAPPPHSPGGAGGAAARGWGHRAARPG